MVRKNNLGHVIARRHCSITLISNEHRFGSVKVAKGPRAFSALQGRFPVQTLRDDTTKTLPGNKKPTSIPYYTPKTDIVGNEHYGFIPYYANVRALITLLCAIPHYLLTPDLSGCL